jgi:transposase-like protein
MGTIFESSHLPLHLWLQVIHLMCASKKGIATRQIQRMLNCSMKTAWHLTHRIREAMKDNTLAPLGGAGQIIEMDDTAIGGKEKNRHASKRKRLGTGHAGKEVVFALVERNGNVRSIHIPKVNSETLRPILKAQIAANTKIASDEHSANKIAASEAGFEHETVNHGSGEYVRGLIHTNTVENYFSILKRGITGCYFHVSEAHLHRYLAEFDFRYSNREKLGINDVARADLALLGVRGKRLTYKTTRGEAAA